MREPLTKRRRPGPQPAPPSHDELFREVFLHALEGCCSQFETSPFVNRKPNFYEGDAELQRARQLVRRSWNIAAYATSMFEEDSQVRDFNKLID